MPSRSKKRASSNRIYTSESDARQVHFPARRRSINPTRPTPPASRTRQQTLTQIDFVTKYLPQDDSLDLDYIEKEASPKRKRTTTLPSRDATTIVNEDRPSKRKRRKTLSAQDTETALNEDRSPERDRRKTPPSKNKPSIMKTRRGKRRKVKQEPETERNATSTTEKRSNATHTHMGPAGSELIPPQTPITARMVEIPSSQSPADTPLSTRRTPSFRNPVRSPLKARSTNTVVPLSVGLKARKLTGWHPKLEVKSNVSWENEDSQPLTVSPSLRTVGKGEYELGRSNVSIGSDNQGQNERSKGALQEPMSTTKQFDRPMQTPKSDISSKTEIRDSDDEEEEDEGEEASSLHDVTNRTQPTEHGIFEMPHIPQSISNQPSPFEAIPSQNTDVPLPGPHAEPPIPPQTPSSSNRELGPKFKDNNALTDGTTSFPIHPLHLQLSSAEAASAQLFNDLYRRTQTQLQPQRDDDTEGLKYLLTPEIPLLDSQSQFGFICRDYTPSPPPLSPIATGAPLSKGPECSHDSTSCSRSSSPSDHLRTSQVSTQSPVLLRRTLHQTAFSEAPPKPPHLQPSQFSTQTQYPLKSPDHNTLHALQPGPQLGPPSESWPSLEMVESEFALPSLPRQGAGIRREQEQQPSSPCRSGADTDADADILPPQTFLQSSPLFAPSLPSSPLLSEMQLQYDSPREDEDESQGVDAGAEVSFEGEGDVWDGKIKTTSQFLPESIFDDESQNLRFDMPPGFSSQLLEHE